MGERRGEQHVGTSHLLYITKYAIVAYVQLFTPPRSLVLSYGLRTELDRPIGSLYRTLLCLDRFPGSCFTSHKRLARILKVLNL